MSFELGFYKDHLLNKLGEAKDRVSAVLKALDNCDVKLKVTTNTSRDDKDKMGCGHHGGLVRRRSKSKCKTSCEHTEERTYKPKYCDWDSDSDSDGSRCDHDDGYRGRTPLYVTGDGGPYQQNVQNINVLCNKRDHGHRGMSRHRPVVVVPTSSPHPMGTLPRHRDGHWCIHGYGPRQCYICFPGYINGPTPHFSRHQNRHQYIPIQGDDGKIDWHDPPAFAKSLQKFSEDVLKQKKEEEDAKKKSLHDTADLIGKLLKLQEPPMGSMWPDSYGSGMGRSAAEIRSELEKAIADKKQLRAGPFYLIREGKRQCVGEGEAQDQKAMCSGALQGGDKDAKKVAEQKQKEKALKSCMKRVGFADCDDCRTFARAQEVDDADGMTVPCNCPEC